MSGPTLRERRLQVVAPSAPPVVERVAKSEVERCGPSDLFHDYVLAEYRPKLPSEGLLRSVNTLVESFAIEGVEQQGLALVNSLRESLGSFRTVWGIKCGAAQLRWELYFYDFERKRGDMSIPSVLSVLRPHLHVETPSVGQLPWHMFSVEFGPEALRNAAPADVNLYVDLRSYKFIDGSPCFENIYSFHDTLEDIDEILHRLQHAPHYDPASVPLSALIPPHLHTCETLCVANKRHADALYFSRISSRALLRFLTDHAWPERLRQFIETRQADHAHLLWDVGVDFRTVAGTMETSKTGIYGSF